MLFWTIFDWKPIHHDQTFILMYLAMQVVNKKSPIKAKIQDSFLSKQKATIERTAWAICGVKVQNLLQKIFLRLSNFFWPRKCFSYIKSHHKFSFFSDLRVRVNKGQRVGAPPRKFFLRGSNLPPLGGPPSQIESACHRYFWPKWAVKVTHRIKRDFKNRFFELPTPISQFF